MTAQPTPWRGAGVTAGLEYLDKAQTQLAPPDGVQAVWLQGGRLHLNHGPIDLILWAEGAGAQAALLRGRMQFSGMLETLCAELPSLRSGDERPLNGVVAQAMAAAVAPFRPAFVTPMAAVAGAVADAVLAAMVAGSGVTRAYVNNGGDIALCLAPGTLFDVALGDGPGRVRVCADDGIGGIATSGWRGRSWSFGIADAVTVLAATAAQADAAATMIANAVDLPGHPAISRRPACDLQSDSDLGARAVTVAVAALPPQDRAHALNQGAAFAQGLMARGLVAGVALFLQGENRIVGTLKVPPPEPQRQVPHG